MSNVIAQLEQIISGRRLADPQSSYVANLAGKGRAKIAQKIGEESIETVIAAIEDDRSETIKESADLIFHLLMLLADMGIKWDDILSELERREGVSGLAEKAARPL